MNRTRREILTWQDVDKLIGYLLPQFDNEYETMILITRGGIVPGGLLAQALDIKRILTASVDFPAEINGGITQEPVRSPLPRQMRGDLGMLAWPLFLQFPEDALMTDQKILIVDDVWGSGRTISAVRSRVISAGGDPYTCVLHFNPHVNRFKNANPNFYAAITDAYIVYPWEVDHGPSKVLKSYV